MTNKLAIWCGQFNPIMGDITHNKQAIADIWEKGNKQNADLVVFTEFAICGYPPEDLLKKKRFNEDCAKAIKELAELTKNGCPMLVGTPWMAEGFLFNAAVLLKDGIVNTIACKTELPNYGVFDELRYFASAPGVSTCTIKGVHLGIAICEDMWFPTVAKGLKNKGAEAIISLNASPFEIDKDDVRCETIRHRSEETQLPILYVNPWGGQDELVFDGRSFAVNPSQGVSFMAPPFADSFFMANLSDKGFTTNENFPPQPERLAELYQAVCCGLKDYITKNGFNKGVVLGLSGGVDSALVAKIATDSLGADKVVGLLMPSPYSSEHSIADAKHLAKNLGIKTHTIPIKAGMAAFDEMLKEIFTGMEENVTEENIQARLRGMLVMAYSNKFGNLPLTTGNKSELSIGYATLYGDMNGGFNPIKDLYKTTVFKLCEHLNKNGEVIPHNTITKPPSAELRPGQQDSDSLPPYEVLDDIIKKTIEKHMSIQEIANTGADLTTTKKITQLLRHAEYKRRQSAPGVKVTSRAFGRDFRLPITNKWVDS